MGRVEKFCAFILSFTLLGGNVLLRIDILECCPNRNGLWIVHPWFGARRQLSLRVGHQKYTTHSKVVIYSALRMYMSSKVISNPIQVGKIKKGKNYNNFRCMLVNTSTIQNLSAWGIFFTWLLVNALRWPPQVCCATSSWKVYSSEGRGKEECWG